MTSLSQLRRSLSSVPRLLNYAMPFAGLVFFGLALWALHQTLGAYRYYELVAALAA